MGLEELFKEIEENSPKKLLEVAKTQTLNSMQLLALKSRSFFVPIRFLHHAQGKEERSKELYIRTAYNILRELDEIEDADNKSLSTPDKIWTINKLSYVIGEIVRRDPNGEEGISHIINGSDFQTVTKKLIQGSATDEARFFVENFGKGSVLRDLYNIGKEKNGGAIKQAIDYSVKSMAVGMIAFLERGHVETARQLDNYCYQVAGRIGSSLLNKIVELEDIEKLDDELAEKCGEYLQLTNITKNARSDHNEGRRFIPGGWIHGAISYEYMMDGKTLDAENTRREVFNDMLNYAKNNFDASVRYIMSIPKKLSGYKAFCLFPLITAQATIQNMEDAGAEKVFQGKGDAVKIPYGIRHITEFCYNIVTHKDGTNTNNWLNEYKKNPRRFSFKPGPEEYESWSQEFLKP